MEIYKLENLSFKYPGAEDNAIDEVSLSINSGEFVTVCGKSGCGKSTLLRQLKPVLTPHGAQQGKILFQDKPINNLDLREQSKEIGFVVQSPDNQIVTDKVWHELAFGLESLGMPTPEIRSKVAEMASFFGIQNWFYKNVSELSGGQKQLLNLASVMVMQPSVLILDEPASQLDPIAAKEFIDVLSKINKELGTTVILSEHRNEETFAVSDRVIVMDKGRIVADDKPCMIADKIKDSDMFDALPVAMRAYVQTGGNGKAPVTVRDGREWLETQHIKDIERKIKERIATEAVVSLKDVWFRYEKASPDIIKGLSAEIHKGEFYAIVGGNGTGKTTTLSLVSGINKPYRGKTDIKGMVGVLPQNPQTLFVKKTVKLDLYEMLSDKKIPKEEKDKMISDIVSLCELEHLLERHPYDLSGGEQQRAALAKVLLMQPQILLLDEPTKGLDAQFKRRLAGILNALKSAGVTVIMVSHDIEFCAEYADRCAMFFDGYIVSEGEPGEFFAGKSFYTTAANRISRGIIDNAVLADDIIRACGKMPEKRAEEIKEFKVNTIEKKTENKLKKSPFKIILGIVFAILFVITVIMFQNKYEDNRSVIVHIVTILFAGVSLHCLLPHKLIGTMPKQVQSTKRILSKRTVVSILMILIAVPLTIYTGFYFLDDKKYYFISLLIIIETMVPFMLVFEDRKPQPRELVIIAVLCAITVAGRAAFSMLPQFKPMMALVIIAGVCFGGETGFLVGAISAFLSNFPFGQGPWTPWQMFAMGIVGFIAGILFKKGFLLKTKVSLCIFGIFSVIIIYGGIMNPASVILWQDNPTKEMIILSFVMGFPFDLVHAAATAFFLWIAAQPMTEKLDRIKTKYGIAE